MKRSQRRQREIDLTGAFLLCEHGLREVLVRISYPGFLGAFEHIQLNDALRGRGVHAVSRIVGEYISMLVIQKETILVHKDNTKNLL